MKIVVTGASGYIGRHVVKKLLDLGNEVIAVDLKHDGIDKRAKISSINIFSDNKNMYYDLESPDVCIHLAWKDGFNHNSDAHLDMLSDHYKFINNMLCGGLKRIVVMGSMHEIGYYEGAVDENTITKPLSFYGVAKNCLREATQLLAKKYDATYLWLRAYYITGDDENNHSIFSKIKEMEKEGKKTFPFVSGKNKYDFLDIEELSYQISIASIQKDIAGVINCCSGKPISLADKVLEFIKKNNFSITPDFGKFPERPYDSPAIWGDNFKINKIIMKFEESDNCNEKNT